MSREVSLFALGAIGIVLTGPRLSRLAEDLAYSAAPVYGDVSPEVSVLTGRAILENSVLRIVVFRRKTEDLGTDVGTERYRTFTCLHLQLVS